MSQENVEAAQRVVDAMNRRDAETLATLSDPEMEFRSALAAVDADVYRGPDGWQTFVDNMSSAWPDWRLDSPRLIDAPDDRVVVLYQFVGTGGASGMQVEHRIGAVVEFREGRVLRIQGYVDEPAALEAVGLSD